MKNLYLDPITKDLALTIDFDLRLTQNNSEYVSQKIENKLLFFLGEWFLNYELGIPYLEYNPALEQKNDFFIFTKNPDLNIVNSLLIAEINSIEEVEEIVEFTSQLDTTLRQLNVDFIVKITNGTIEGSVTI